MLAPSSSISSWVTGIKHWFTVLLKLTVALGKLFKMSSSIIGHTINQILSRLRERYKGKYATVDSVYNPQCITSAPGILIIILIVRLEVKLISHLLHNVFYKTKPCSFIKLVELGGDGMFNLVWECSFSLA